VTALDGFARGRIPVGVLAVGIRLRPVQLRATAACVIEWLLVLDRQGWLSPGQNERAAIRVMEPKGAFTRIMRRRRRDHIRGGEWRPHRAPPRKRPKRSPVRTP